MSDLYILHRALLSDCLYNIFPASKCRYVFSVSKYSKIQSLINADNFSAGSSGEYESFYSCMIAYSFSSVSNFGTKLLAKTAYNKSINLASRSTTSKVIKSHGVKTSSLSRKSK